MKNERNLRIPFLAVGLVIWYAGCYSFGWVINALPNKNQESPMKNYIILHWAVFLISCYV